MQKTMDQSAVELEVKLTMLRDWPMVTDLDADGDLTYELNGRTYLVQVKALDMGPTVD